MVIPYYLFFFGGGQLIPLTTDFSQCKFNDNLITLSRMVDVWWTNRM